MATERPGQKRPKSAKPTGKMVEYRIPFDYPGYGGKEQRLLQLEEKGWRVAKMANRDGEFVDKITSQGIYIEKPVEERAQDYTAKRQDFAARYTGAVKAQGGRVEQEVVSGDDIGMPEDHSSDPIPVDIDG